MKLMFKKHLTMLEYQTETNRYKWCAINTLSVWKLCVAFFLLTVSLLPQHFLHRSYNAFKNAANYIYEELMCQCCVAGSQFEDRTLTADENRNEDVILNEINRQYRNQ